MFVEGVLIRIEAGFARSVSKIGRSGFFSSHSAGSFVGRKISWFLWLCVGDLVKCHMSVMTSRCDRSWVIDVLRNFAKRPESISRSIGHKDTVRSEKCQWDDRPRARGPVMRRHWRTGKTFWIIEVKFLSTMRKQDTLVWRFKLCWRHDQATRGSRNERRGRPAIVFRYKCVHLSHRGWLLCLAAVHRR